MDTMTLNSEGAGSARARRLRVCATLITLAVVVAASLVPAVGSASAAVVRPFEGGFGPDGTTLSAFGEPGPLAVDQATGSLYVGDISAGTVQKFSSTHAPEPFTGTNLEISGGKLAGFSYLAASGPTAFNQLAVDSADHDLYVVAGGGTSLKAYEADGEPAEFTAGPGAGTDQIAAVEPCGVAVDADGTIYLAEASAIQVYAASGEPLTSIPVGARCNLAVNSTGKVYADLFEGGVESFAPSEFPVTTATTYGAGAAIGPEHARSIGVDRSDDHVFVDETTQISEYEESGTKVRTFAATGAGAVTHSEAVAPLAGTDAVYVTDAQGQKQVGIFGPPTLLPDVTTLPPTAQSTTSATLEGEVDPSGVALTQCLFEYGETIGYGNTTPCVAPDAAEIPVDSNSHPVHAELTGLTPGAEIHYRLVAANANGTNRESGDQAFFTGASIESTSVSGVSSDSADLEATINPQGVATSYHFEYVTQADFAAHGFAGATSTSSASAGSDTTGVALSVHVQNLVPATEYVFRVVVDNSLGRNFGPERSFTSQLAPNPLLPDGRGYELVSPVDKLGSAILPMGEEGVIQSASDGSAFTYQALGPVEPQPEGNNRHPQVLSIRRGAGWSTKQITIPHQVPVGAATGGGQEYQFFSNDLSGALLQPAGPFPTPGSAASLSPDASEQTPYVRMTVSGGSFCAPLSEPCYRPLVTGAGGLANVPPGRVFGGHGGPKFLGATEDLSHVILSSDVALTDTPLTGASGLYEWSADAPPSQQLKLVSELPDRTAATGGLSFGAARTRRTARGALGHGGSRVFWETSGASGTGHLYVHDLELGQTVELDEVQGGSGKGAEVPQFQIADSTADRVFFTDQQRLLGNSGGGEFGGPASDDFYESHLVEATADLECELADLTPLGPGEEEAEVQGLLLGISEDGGAVYFVAQGALSGGEVNEHGEVAVSGQPNLYVRQGGQTKLIAVLSPEDAPTWGELAGLAKLPARVSPDGRYLAFQSQRPLTGYDNRDAVSGERDEEVFLYDSQTGRLSCASCDPSGARPEGSKAGTHLQRANSVWPPGTWLAATVPGWTSYQLGNSLYQSRYLSNSGRLFFNSYDALAPEDSNGTADVYEYEPTGVGTCSSSDDGYVPAGNACVDLISSGTSTEESGFLDASESGDDVFFLTSSELTSKDVDQIGDVYDARVGGGEAAGPQPVQCEGDGCQQPAVPPVDATPGSLTFSGPGNVLECPKGKAVKGGKCVKKSGGKKHKKHKAKHKKKTPRRRIKSKRGSGR
jgi:hypothetical protein